MYKLEEFDQLFSLIYLVVRLEMSLIIRNETHYAVHRLNLPTFVAMTFDSLSFCTHGSPNE